MKFRNLTIPFNARNDRQTGINVKDKVKKLLIPIIIEGEHLIEKNVYFNIKKFRKWADIPVYAWRSLLYWNKKNHNRMEKLSRWKILSTGNFVK